MERAPVHRRSVGKARNRYRQRKKERPGNIQRAERRKVNLGDGALSPTKGGV
jgi:hypothetical protein